MKAITLIPGTTNVSLQELPDPVITAADDIKLRTIQVGICGTDREEVNGGRAIAPHGKDVLVIGHELFGEVIEVGRAVRAVRPGDFAMFTVRRGCGNCRACIKNRSDMSFTGDYTERGIKGADGFQAEYVVDKEKYIVKIPAEIKDIGVLTEPMSVAAKAIDEALSIQAARLGDFENTENWFAGKKALIAGIGPIGLMAAFALRLRGVQVIGMDIVDQNTLRPSVLKSIGGIYSDGRKVDVLEHDDLYGQIDFVFEAAGIASLQIKLIDTLGINGIYVATGIPADERSMNVPVGSLMRELVLKNQVVLGSVNAGIQHYRMAVKYLEESKRRWPAAIQQIITERIPFTEFHRALHPQTTNEIKVVIEW